MQLTSGTYKGGGAESRSFFMPIKRRLGSCFSRIVVLAPLAFVADYLYTGPPLPRSLLRSLQKNVSQPCRKRGMYAPWLLQPCLLRRR